MGKIMKEKNFTVTKLNDSPYGKVIPNLDSKTVYCEIQYQRDRSSFAGIALKVTNGVNNVVVRECKEKYVQSLGKYEKLYIGCENVYVDSIKEIFFLEKRTYGIEIVFLIYSDIRSSQNIFEELMKIVDQNIESIILKSQ